MELSATGRYKGRMCILPLIFISNISLSTHQNQLSTHLTLCCPGDYKTQGLLRFGYVQMNANGAVVGFGEASTVRVASLVHILCSINSQRSSTFVKDAILGLAAF